MRHPSRSSYRVFLGLLALLLEIGIPISSRAATPAGKGTPSSVPQTEHVVLFVLEGFSHDSLKGAAMPIMKKLIKEGSVTWTAGGVEPALRLPTMASLITGMPVEKHGITWNSFEFSRGYPRPPSLFDYLDLSGGRDSAIFFMDEALYQLAKPTPYTDYQLCGALRPECGPQKLVAYIQQYFRKATSGHGYGHAVLSLPHLLVVHLPEAGRTGVTHGWNSKEYLDALQAVDASMKSVLDLFAYHKLLDRTTVLITALNGKGTDPGGETPTSETPVVPWIVSGAGIKRGQTIHQPVSIIDTGATVMRILKLETHTEWDSRVVEEIFQTTPTAQKPMPRAKKR